MFRLDTPFPQPDRLSAAVSWTAGVCPHRVGGVVNQLFSFHLLLLAIFLTLPDLPRLANLFLLGRPAEAVADCRLFRRPWLDRTAATVRTALVPAFAGLLLAVAYQERHSIGDLRPKPPLYGI